MSDHPIQGLMTTAMESLKEMIDVNTIIGDPVETPDGSVILTVSRVGFGFAAGGSEFKMDTSQGQGQGGQGGQSQGGLKLPFGGGSGAGVSITPIAFLIVNSQGVKMLHLDESTHLYEKILELAPQAVDKIQQMFAKKDEAKQQSSPQYQNNQAKHDFDI
ncbi:MULTISPECIES: GerW family sporulation protein [Neobacillus]|uniref:GerW family sporulation protein n=1 Tax=Neobacillus rhizophilus TaxID=2833579 RepID=A0A942U9E4_9BACI|nr:MULTISPECIES: GerW family sporulation protein [Neobacillus]MBS4215362.1 GerW family sporulation protein [Neobacillus rhizophilus]MBU8919563.1 GerW family sporulation protein [Bacillus sp. FJAT-29953]